MDGLLKKLCDNLKQKKEFRQEEGQLETERKEFKVFFKDSILSFKNHVNHYSYVNVIFYTAIKLVYQSHTQMPDDSLDLQSDQLFDVYRIIRLIIDDIDEDSLSNKVIDKYDIHAVRRVGGRWVERRGGEGGEEGGGEGSEG